LIAAAGVSIKPAMKTHRFTVSAVMMMPLPQTEVAKAHL